MKVRVSLANSDLRFDFLKICRIMENLIILVANLKFGGLFNMVTIYFTVMCSFAHFKIIYSFLHFRNFSFQHLLSKAFDDFQKYL